MSVVFITIPGSAKRDFANALNERIDGNLDLIVLQKSPQKPLVKKLIDAFKHMGFGVLREAWYAVLLRSNKKVRNALAYFGGNNRPSVSNGYTSPTMEVQSVNSDEVYEALKKISPDLLVVWGSTILTPRILSTAKRAINLHLGFCPYYRGALANQCAVFDDEFSRIGATIHYINGKADAGDILTVISADVERPPQELFRDLHTRAGEAYLSIASALHRGEVPPSTPQDISKSKNFFLKNWVPSLRYKVGKKILAWEKKMIGR